MSSEGLMRIVLAVNKNTLGTFTAADIYEETGLDRQLVYYHLTRLVDKGLLEKSGPKYIICDREQLLELLAYGQANITKTEAEPTIIYTKHNTDILNQIIRVAHLARAAGIPGSKELKESVNRDINDTIMMLNTVKRIMNRKRKMNKRKAHKALKKYEDFTEDYIKFTTVFEVPNMNAEVIDELVRAIQEEGDAE